MIIGDIGLTICLEIDDKSVVTLKKPVLFFWKPDSYYIKTINYLKMTITLYMALMYPIDWVFKKNVNQSIQNSLVFIIFPGRIFSPWCWLICTTILDRCEETELSVPSVAKFLWMEDVDLLLSKWKPWDCGLFNSKSSSSSPAVRYIRDLYSTLLLT